MHQPTDRIAHTTAFAKPVVEHSLEREILFVIDALSKNWMLDNISIAYRGFFFVQWVLYMTKTYKIKREYPMINISMFSSGVNKKMFVLNKGTTVYN